jgi:hypothetical protein
LNRIQRKPVCLLSRTSRQNEPQIPLQDHTSCAR